MTISNLYGIYTIEYFFGGVSIKVLLKKENEMYLGLTTAGIFYTFEAKEAFDFGDYKLKEFEIKKKELEKRENIKLETIFLDNWS